jgi:hypothetical protein
VSISISVVVCTRIKVESLQQCEQALASLFIDHEWELGRPLHRFVNVRDFDPH